MEKPKILLISTSLNIGGSEKWIESIYDNLKEDYHINICYLKEFGIIGKRLEKKGAFVTKLNGIPGIFKELKKGKYEVLHSFLYRANILSRIAGKLAGVPVITTQQAIDKWKPLPLLAIDILTSPLSDKILTNSFAAKESIIKNEKIPESKIKVIYNGINFKKADPVKKRMSIRQELIIPENTKVVAYAGRLHREKGVDFIPEIAANIKNAVFLIIGDGEERPYLTNQINKLNLKNKFILTGWRDDVNEYLNAADIFIMPSREESFPQSLLEAMYQKLPSVAFDIGGIKEILKDGVNGRLIRYMDIQMFTEALQSLIDDNELCTKMGNASRETAMKFSEDKMLNQIKDLYQEQLSKKRGYGN